MAWPRCIIAGASRSDSRFAQADLIAYRAPRAAREGMPGALVPLLADRARMFFRKVLTMAALTLAQANTIVDAALQKGRDIHLAPLVVAVLDAGGHLVAFKREDKAGIMRFDIAFGKAWGALGMGFGSRQLAVRAAANPTFVNALAAASGGRLVPVPGGVLIRDAAGDVIGAVGVSGDLSDRDEECALAGIEAAGLKGDPGAAQ